MKAVSTLGWTLFWAAWVAAFLSGLTAWGVLMALAAVCWVIVGAIDSDADCGYCSTVYGTDETIRLGGIE